MEQWAVNIIIDNMAYMWSSSPSSKEDTIPVTTAFSDQHKDLSQEMQ